MRSPIRLQVPPVLPELHAPEVSAATIREVIKVPLTDTKANPQSPGPSSSAGANATDSTSAPSPAIADAAPGSVSREAAGAAAVNAALAPLGGGLRSSAVAGTGAVSAGPLGQPGKRPAPVTALSSVLKRPKTLSDASSPAGKLLSAAAAFVLTPNYAMYPVCFLTMLMSVLVAFNSCLGVSVTLHGVSCAIAWIPKHLFTALHAFVVHVGGRV